MKSVQNFYQISRYAGMREDLVQAGGGNTSVKISGEEMLIKASGYQLAEVDESHGYARVNYKMIQDFFEQRPLESITKSDEKALLEQCFIEGERASIETFLHAITEKVTLHTHALVVNLLTDSKTGMDTLRDMFSDALFVPYATPGIELAKAYFKAFVENGHPCHIVFLKNHGLITCGETYEDVKDLTEKVLDKIQRKLNVDYSRYSNATALYDALYSAGIRDRIVCLMKSEEIYKAYEKNDYSIWNLAICPDALVYCGKKVLSLDDSFSRSDISGFIEEYGTPAVILFKGYFYACAPTVKKAKEIESLFCFTAEVLTYHNVEDLDYLDENEQNYLLNWDAEKYRRSMK